MLYTGFLQAKNSTKAWSNKNTKEMILEKG